MSSPFRFVTSNKRSEYGVWRGDEHVGFVTKVAHRIGNKTFVAGWMPTTLDRTELGLVDTRERAARVLWTLHQTRR